MSGLSEWAGKEHEALLRDMTVFAVQWHRARRCACMAAHSQNSINVDTFWPCPHLQEASEKEFEQRIEDIDAAIGELIAERLDKIRSPQ